MPLPKVEQGVAGSVLLPSGRVVTAISYASEAEPFAVIVDGDKRPAPWACVASPAQIEASGESVWVRCIDPDDTSSNGRVHFWLSEDGGEHFVRVGARTGMVAEGSVAHAGSTLLVADDFDGTKAPLLVIRRRDGASQVTVPEFSDGPPLAGARLLPVADVDGSHAALVALLVKADGCSLQIYASNDRAASFRHVSSTEWSCDVLPSHASLVDQTLAFTSGKHAAPEHVSLVEVGAAPLVTRDLDPTPEAVCLHGASILLQTADGFRLSRDGAKSFTRAPAPPAPDGDAILSCHGAVVRIGDYVWRFAEGV